MIKERSQGAHPSILTGDDLIAHDGERTNVTRCRVRGRLFEVPNLVLSPHIAGATRETAHRAASIASAEVGRYARGEELANPVNLEVGSENRSG
jgi:lactate dehydrogenase-like 2-hydroxyacid dehydrogenase